MQTALVMLLFVPTSFPRPSVLPCSREHTFTGYILQVLHQLANWRQSSEMGRRRKWKPSASVWISSGTHIYSELMAPNPIRLTGVPKTFLPISLTHGLWHNFLFHLFLQQRPVVAILQAAWPCPVGPLIIPTHPPCEPPTPRLNTLWFKYLEALLFPPLFLT